MSLKKDNFSILDKKYMKLAINLAENQKNNTGLNPSVGCIIVKNNEISSYGSTYFNGRPHAESIALKKNQNNNKGSTLYITLEPCSHYGKTPPCTNLIIKSKIKKVIYSKNDTDDRSKCKAKKILLYKKINCKSGLLKNTTKELYKEYDYIRKYKMPYVVGKIACTKNNYIYIDNKPITNRHSKSVSHILRSQNDAILTSYKTINNDNPKLTCRLQGLNEKSPKRVILDSDLKVKLNSYVIRNSKFPKTFIFHDCNNRKKITKLKKLGVKVIKLKTNNNRRFNLKNVLTKMYKLGFHRILTEFGKNLTYHMVIEKYFNDFYLFKSDKISNRHESLNVSKIINKLNKNYKKKENLNTYLENDNIVHYC